MRWPWVSRRDYDDMVAGYEKLRAELHRNAATTVKVAAAANYRSGWKDGALDTLEALTTSGMSLPPRVQRWVEKRTEKIEEAG